MMVRVIVARFLNERNPDPELLRSYIHLSLRPGPISWYLILRTCRSHCLKELHMMTSRNQLMDSVPWSRLWPK
jgi:hypothetical protein